MTKDEIIDALIKKCEQLKRENEALKLALVPPAKRERTCACGNKMFGTAAKKYCDKCAAERERMRKRKAYTKKEATV